MLPKFQMLEEVCQNENKPPALSSYSCTLPSRLTRQRELLRGSVGLHEERPSILRIGGGALQGAWRHLVEAIAGRSHSGTRGAYANPAAQAPQRSYRHTVPGGRNTCRVIAFVCDVLRTPSLTW